MLAENISASVHSHWNLSIVTGNSRLVGLPVKFLLVLIETLPDSKTKGRRGTAHISDWRGF